jgi:hypothetical protein
MQMPSSTMANGRACCAGAKPKPQATIPSCFRPLKSRATEPSHRLVLLQQVTPVRIVFSVPF